jgi:hypothetical protein
MIDNLINQYGSESQRERHAEGRLPESELRALACALLFRSLDDLPRYRRLEPNDIRHEPARPRVRACTGTGFKNESIAQFKVDDDYRGPMSSDQWAAWTKIRNALRGFPPLDLAQDVGLVAHKIRRHEGECVGCGARRQRLSVLVTVQFYGLVLSREYAL